MNENQFETSITSCYPNTMLDEKTHKYIAVNETCSREPIQDNANLNSNNQGNILPKIMSLLGNNSSLNSSNIMSLISNFMSNSGQNGASILSSLLENNNKKENKADEKSKINMYKKIKSLD